MRAILCSFIIATSVGCYAPDPPSGSYLCATDGACPTGLSCTCGQCVASADEAACSFQIASSDGSKVIEKAEHETFSITIAAFGQDGTPATKFSGAATLSSTWGDVCVGTSGCISQPHEVQLMAGVATTMVSLNRETIDPQSAILRADFAGATGNSGKLRISITPPKFVRDVEVVAPLTLLPATSFGFATEAVGAPAVVKTSDGWRMYFLGGVKGPPSGTGIGVATSTDGAMFSPMSMPLYEAPSSSDTSFGVASAFTTAAGTTELYFGQKPSTPAVFSQISRLMSTGGAFVLDSDPVMLAMSNAPNGCPNSLCLAIDGPNIIADPDPSLTGGSANAKIMYFSTVQKDTSNNESLAVMRAASLDGVSFVADPAPLLQSTRDELVMLSPRVIVDGSVFKMFYSFTPLGLDPIAALNPCSKPSTYQIGYATSSDGYFWVRSPNNSLRSALGTTLEPALGINPDLAAWDGGKSILLGSVVPKDGIDPALGLYLYYSPYDTVPPLTGTCTTNGIGRASF